ncbi:MAG: NAD(P)/FAD-dependent oxidoreductase [Burkholderiales bacterium]|nr:NAD(P)/FAD-dependent oxidoreductase [Burkholderiales bacterium]
MEHLDCVVVGAGVIGLAVARALAGRGREVVVLEAEPAIGMHTSSHNSEVVHAGIYYPAGSLKARLCVAGRSALYDYCASRGVPHRRCGKLIVATHPGQHGRLAALKAQAEANGVNDLEWIGAARARALEPELACSAALASPSTGIVDSHAYMLALQGEAQSHGATVVLRSPVLRGEARAGGVALDVGGAEPMRLAARCVVNAAGLFAQALAHGISGLAPESIPACHYAKGNYFTLRGRAPFSRLIYPVPESAGLGVHLTLDLAGQARFGPDVQWVSAVDYSVDPARAAGFYAAIRAYWPGLAQGALEAGYAGVRPKLQPPGGPAEDFLIQGPRDHGVPGLVNLYGIESPGLTASLAIAEEVCARLGASPPA